MKRIICALTLLCLVFTALPGLDSSAQAAPAYYITVDLTNQIVTVYDNGNTSESGIVRQMICTTGKPATPTPVGTYTLPAKSRASERTEWYYFPEYNCYAKWATRIIGGILFHSVLYTAAKAGPTRASNNALGSKASHGCVRLRVNDAKWIAQNCPAGTKVKIYNSGKTNSSLRKKLKSKSFSRASQTYDEYMGRATGHNLSRGSRGDSVSELQGRLKALGFANGTVDGKFGAATATAVKRFQAAAGVKKTGKVNESLWNAMFADGAPTGTYATLSQGFTGPAAAVLQQALADLKLYEGAVDGSYGEATTQAVLRYQQSFGFAPSGAADQALQQDAIARAGSVKAQFGNGNYRLVTAVVQAEMARVNVRSYVYLRSKASKKGKALGKLKNGVELLVEEKGASWTRVTFNRVTGYVQNRYLEFFVGEVTAASYEAAEATPEPTVTPEPTPEPTATPEIIIPTPTPEIFIPTPEPSATPEGAVVLAIPAEETVDEVTVELGGETTPEPTVEPTVEPTPEPTVEPTPEPTAEPTVETTPEPAIETTPEPDGEPAQAVAGAAVVQREGAALYALPEAEQPVLAELPLGEALEVLEVREDWIAVSHDGGTAWIPAADVTLDDTRPEAAEPMAVAAPELVPGEETEPEPEYGDAGAGGLIIEEEPLSGGDDPEDTWTEIE